MRKSIHIIISALLLLATSGITVSAHYCHDRLIEKKIDGKLHSCCDDDSCCHNETVTYRITDDFAASVFHLDGPNVIQNLHDLYFTEDLNDLYLSASMKYTDISSILKLPFSCLSPDQPLIQSFLL